MRKLVLFSVFCLAVALSHSKSNYLEKVTSHLAPRTSHLDNYSYWPDGTKMDAWFADTARVSVGDLGRQYVVTKYGVKKDSLQVQTVALQRVIDMVAEKGGGVVVIPKGVFLSGALHFRQGTHLWLQEGARLKGSDRIEDFPVCETRIEGQTCRYFPTLVNADGLDGFVILGPGTIDGNGRHYWREFWIRREWNPQCTNKDAQRPRLVYISNSRNVTVQGVRTINSPFWTNHLYRCEHVRYLDCYIYAPTGGVFDFAGKEHGAPSSDAIDLDVCSDVVVRGCYMNVCDDAVVLKGGKGTWADTMAVNGPCERILIEDCHYGRVHGCLTLGSESVHDRNVILRNCHSDAANRVLWLKMRPDTPQHYEHVLVDGITGHAGSFLVVRPWTQFFKPEGRLDMPVSRCNNITIKNIDMTCKTFWDVGESERYQLSDFMLENIEVRSEKDNPFRYSMNVPDGNYKVTVTIGSRYHAGETCIRAESRRLFFEPVKTQKGELRELSFVVNKRSPIIFDSINPTLVRDSIRIKPREKNYINWDGLLTLEFCGSNPLVNSLRIERDTTAKTLFLCGNSTVVDQEYEPWASWGQMIPRWFDTHVSVANYAESGLTASSFLAQKRFDKILSQLRQGDYVICEFGHNDQKERSPGAGAYLNFSSALKRFIDGTRQKGATIVFCTPTQRRSFDEQQAHIVETHGDYPQAMRDVASSEDVPVIELHDMTRVFFETLGFEDSKQALVHYPANTFPGQEKPLADNTHFNPYGAYEVAKMVVEGMKALNLPIASFIRDDWKSYDPATPDAFSSFAWPSSGLFELKKPDGN